MIEITNIKVIEVQDWDKLVKETYGKPYSFQQQDGCQSRGLVPLTIPDWEYDYEEDMNDSIPEKLETDEMGVKFDVWLARDPKIKINNREEDYYTEIWWHRNFYPCLQVVANDLHKKGLIPEGEYHIRIDW